MNAQQFLSAVTEALDVPPARDEKALLDLTRDIAHGMERWCGPVTMFLLGQAVAAGGDLEELSARVRSLLPAG